MISVIKELWQLLSQLMKGDEGSSLLILFHAVNSNNNNNNKTR